MKLERVRLRVRGVVQGVGFRPYVYRLAQRYSLAGFVFNSPEGVVIEVEGAGEALENFCKALTNEAPPLVILSEIVRSEIPAENSTAFVIRQSENGERIFALVPPDICSCTECLAETNDPQDRRFWYPFTNCTNCGPRYSIIENVPYDRAQTTMAEFTMCAACEAEYFDPANRRFHAQPNACPVCGPSLRLGNRDTQGSSSPDAREVLAVAANILLAAGIVAWKGLGGYQLACNARDEAAVAKLRQRKRRSEKPFAVMVGNIATAKDICFISDAERAALESSERPIVLLQRRPGATLAQGVSPDNLTAGILLPCTPMHDLLFRMLHERSGTEGMLVMTSGNVSEEPIVIGEVEAEEQLGMIADTFVHHNRRIHTRVDDSVLRIFDGAPLIMRRSRGYAPRPIPVAFCATEVLACGAQQKSTLCLTKAGTAIPSQHLGDLENYETLRFFEETLARMRKLFHIDPTVIAHDLHPGYLSTQLALQLPAKRHIGVQHHHAHIASCMAEHGLQGRVIGVAWDGTGLGTDGTVWGGEFLVADLAGFDRYAHLRPVLLAGGEQAVRQPWRVAKAYLYDTFDTVNPQGIGCWVPQSSASERLVNAMLEQRINTIETSSCGRLFDAIASLIGLRHTVSFEGQAAMALEAVAADDMHERYDFAIADSGSRQIDLRPMIRQLVEDLKRSLPPDQLSARFHNTLVAIVSEVCRRMRRELGLTRVCLSGGCFQNLRLLRGCVETLRGDSFDVFYQRLMPANDGGISLGQAAVACELMRRGA